MARLIAWRLLGGAGVLFVVAALIFAGTEMLPGSAADAILGRDATPEAVAALQEQLGLNQPATVRFFRWLGDFITGDFGQSFSNGRDIATIVAERGRATLLLAAAAAGFSVPLAIMLGLLSALAKPEKPVIDRTLSGAALLLISMPEFLLAYLVILWLSIEAGWLPAISVPADNWANTARNLVLPVLALSGQVVAYIMRMTRATILNEMSNPYFEMALLKGVSQPRAVFAYAFPAALGPILNVVAINLAYLLVGVVVVEVIFNYPGLGQLMIDSVSFRDLPTVQTVGMLFCTVFVLLNLGADLLAIISNPRLRHPK